MSLSWFDVLQEMDNVKAHYLKGLDPLRYVAIMHPLHYQNLKLQKILMDRWNKTYAHWEKYPQRGKRAKRLKEWQDESIW